MTRITHVFNTLCRYNNGVLVSKEEIERLAVLDYNLTGTMVDVTIMPNLSTKKAFLIKQDGFTLYYEGTDSPYLFEIECWPDNGTIKRLSVKRTDTGVEYRYLSTHQDRMF